ncbi:probable glutamate receptor isoform X2 [Eriocheir sinensis]|uniref:probable glutamate receptor isoform X2 n=1 Tax=Eriocheir sinensis TaxID=95602 RepID=UPI0021C9D110|nr:probable glutamate receptor isoform X2 [Eriocheir sinensis]
MNLSLFTAFITTHLLSFVSSRGAYKNLHPPLRMKVFALLLAFLSLLATTTITAEAANVISKNDLTAMMLTDLLQFFQHRRACLLASKASDQQWMPHAVWRVTRASNAFLAVLRVTEVNSTKHRVSRGHESMPSDCEVLVTHLATREDVYLFGQVFSAQPSDATWLVVTPAREVTQRLGTLYLPLDNRVTVAVYSPEPDNTTISLLSCYHIHEGDVLRVKRDGAWYYNSQEKETNGCNNNNNNNNNENSNEGTCKEKDAPLLLRQMTYGVVEVLEGDPVLRRRDLHGMNLRCTTISSPPRTILNKVQDGSVEVTGILGSAYKHMMQVANFTSTCFATRDGHWGALKQDGHWTGLVRDIVEGHADIAMASLDVTQQRSRAVDFLMVVMRTQYLLIMKRPTNDDRKWSTFTAEFEVRVWLVLVMSLVAIHATLCLTSLQHPQQPLHPGDALMVVVAGLCGQGTNAVFRTTSSRLVFLTLLMLQVLILAHYTSYLVSSMAVGPPLPTVSTIADVTRHPRLRLSILRGSSIIEYFRTSSNPDHQEAWQKVREEDFVESREEGTDRVLHEPYVYLDAGPYLNQRFGADCRYFILPSPNFPSMSAFAVKKGSPLIPILNSIILKMKSTGLMAKWHSEWAPRPADCSDFEFVPVEASVVATAFLLLSSGAALSIVCLAWERNKAREKKMTYSRPK